MDLHKFAPLQICRKYITEVRNGQKCYFFHMEPTQSVCVADCYFVVNVLDLPFASPI